ncbi:MAG: NINE protein [Pseudoclavibacter sp.]
MTTIPPNGVGAPGDGRSPYQTSAGQPDSQQIIRLDPSGPQRPIVRTAEAQAGSPPNAYAPSSSNPYAQPSSDGFDDPYSQSSATPSSAVVPYSPSGASGGQGSVSPYGASSPYGNQAPVAHPVAPAQGGRYAAPAPYGATPAYAGTPYGGAPYGAAVGLPRKDMTVTYLLAIFLGGFGAHQFYLGRTGPAVTQLILYIVGWLTVWIFIGSLVWLALGIWVIVDLFLIPGLVRNINATRGYGY